MAENVYEVLKLNHTKLVEDVLDKNEEISKFLMLMYSHILYTVMDKKDDPRNIVLHYSIQNGEHGDFLKIDVRYESRERDTEGRLDGKNPVKRNMSLVRLLEVNKNIRDAAVRVVELLERWINEKPYRKELGLKSIKLEDAMFWKNMVFTADIMLHVEWEEMVKLKTKFFDDEDLTAEHPIVDGGYLV